MNTMSSGIKLLGFCGSAVFLAVACQPDLDSLSEAYDPNGAGSSGMGNSNAGTGNENSGGGPVSTTCTNKRRDPNETDVDCGGSSKCGACGTNLHCNTSKDCLSEFCSSGSCA